MAKARKTDWSKVDAARAKPRVSIVLSAEEREAGERLAQARCVSLSTLIGRLILDEVRRDERRRA